MMRLNAMLCCPMLVCYIGFSNKHIAHRIVIIIYFRIIYFFFFMMMVVFYYFLAPLLHYSLLSLSYFISPPPSLPLVVPSSYWLSWPQHARMHALSFAYTNRLQVLEYPRC